MTPSTPCAVSNLLDSCVKFHLKGGLSTFPSTHIVNTAEVDSCVMHMRMRNDLSTLPLHTAALGDLFTEYFLQQPQDQNKNFATSHGLKNYLYNPSKNDVIFMSQVKNLRWKTLKVRTLEQELKKVTV